MYRNPFKLVKLKCSNMSQCLKLAKFNMQQTFYDLILQKLFDTLYIYWCCIFRYLSCFMLWDPWVYAVYVQHMSATRIYDLAYPRSPIIGLNLWHMNEPCLRILLVWTNHGMLGTHVRILFVCMKNWNTIGHYSKHRLQNMYDNYFQLPFIREIIKMFDKVFPL